MYITNKFKQEICLENIKNQTNKINLEIISKIITIFLSSNKKLKYYN